MAAIWAAVATMRGPPVESQMTQMSADGTDGLCGAGEPVCGESVWACGLVAVLASEGAATGRAAGAGAVGGDLGSGGDHKGTSRI